MRLGLLRTMAALICVCHFGCIEQRRPTKLKPGVTLELHTVATAPSENTHALTDPDSGMQLHLVEPPVITTQNVIAATFQTDEDDIDSLEVKLDNAGVSRLNAATAALGGRIAIVVNGKIVATPRIRSPLTSAFRLTGNADWEQFVE